LDQLRGSLHLEYLADQIRGVLGSHDSVGIISGSVKREDRRAVQERFRHDPDMMVLVATDAAGEGVNLQNANLMVNYDLPWNPNRIEQRFGRIHRIGQTEVCHLWNLVAFETREGAVFKRLFEKMEVQREALEGKVFNVLGDAFSERSLRDMLIEAIRGKNGYGRGMTSCSALRSVQIVLRRDPLRS
jgi:SNF2 family DNA or RNA helicase